MSQTVILFHSALGLRPAVGRFADRLREAGHVVHTPDLYDGRVFDSLEEGVAYRDLIGGVPALVGRAKKATEGLSAAAVYAGFSLGAAAAQMLALGRPGARGLVLMHGVIPPEYLGVKTWPGISVQIHHAEADPWVEAAEVDGLRALVEAAGQTCAVFTYRGSAHLFADDDCPDYDRDSAEAMIDRVLGYLGRVGER